MATARVTIRLMNRATRALVVLAMRRLLGGPAGSS
jgi:hypothetical protein